MMEGVTIRPIEIRDNVALAKIIRNSLEEFKANKPGTVYFDESTDRLFDLFKANAKSYYYVAELDDKVVGGAGIYPTEGLPAEVCELVKMYLSPSIRGLGLGKAMIEKCIKTAKDFGFTKIYLETMPELRKAVTVYEKLGFTYLHSAMGNSGHSGCDIWMIKEI